MIDAADPARTLALLWGDHTRTARRGKRDLSVAKIVGAGIDLADTSGLDALSMRRVAEVLGVGTMSLYTHIPGKAELIAVMVDTVYIAIATVNFDETNDWRRRLSQVATADFEALIAHPWLLRVPVTGAILGPGAAAKYERELSTIDDIGLSDVDMDGVVALVNGHAMASARRATETSAQTDPQQWWQTHAPLLAGIADYSRFPLAARVGNASGTTHGSPYAADGGFAFGLSRIIDGVGQLITPPP